MDLYEGSSLEHLALLTHLGEEYQFGVPPPTCRAGPTGERLWSDPETAPSS